MEYYVYQSSDGELCHWGIKGMKWGVRRYQNKDGSLTPAGKKRVAAEKNALKERERIIKQREKAKAERTKLDAKKAELDARERALNDDDKPRNSKKHDLGVTASSRPKSISEMSIDELKEATARMNAEKDYYQAKQNLAAITPRQVSKGQQIAETLLNDAVIPAVKNAGKSYLEKMLKEKAGIKDDVKINWDEMLKKQTYAKNEADKVYQDLKRQNDINQEKDRAEARDKKRSEESKKNKDSKTTDKPTGSSKKDDNGSSKTDKKTESKVYEGTVEGTGTSRKSTNEPKWTSKKETVIDADFYEVNTSDIPTSMTTRGQSYITALLEPPKERDDD